MVLVLKKPHFPRVVILLIILGIVGILSFWVYKTLSRSTSVKESISLDSASLENLPALPEIELEALFLPQYLNLQKTEIFLPKKQIEVQVTPSDLLPPQNVKIYDPGLGDRIRIVWDPPLSSYDGINIYRSLEATQLGEKIAEVKYQNFFEDNTVKAGNTYYYTLKSVRFKGNNEIEESDPTSSLSITPHDLTPPLSPTNIEVAYGEEGTVILTWKDPPDPDLAKINIYRSTTKGEIGDKITSVEAGTEKYEDKEVQSGRNYYYVLRAEDKNGNESPFYLIKAGNPDPFLLILPKYTPPSS